MGVNSAREATNEKVTAWAAKHPGKGSPGTFRDAAAFEHLTGPLAEGWLTKLTNLADAAIVARLQAIEQELLHAMARWDELDSLTKR